MIDLKSMTLEEMGAYLKTGGEPAFRAKQIFTWLHRGVGSFEEMTNLSKALREKLSTYMIPSKIEILPQLPRNANGKTDRVLLRTLLP